MNNHQERHAKRNAKRRAVALWNEIAKHVKSGGKLTDGATVPSRVQEKTLGAIHAAREWRFPNVPRLIWRASLAELRRIIEAVKGAGKALDWYTCAEIAHVLNWLMDADYTATVARRTLLSGKKLHAAILKLYETGKLSGRAIEKRLHVSHNVVSRVLEKSRKRLKTGATRHV